MKIEKIMYQEEWEKKIRYEVVGFILMAWITQRY